MDNHLCIGYHNATAIVERIASGAVGEEWKVWYREHVPGNRGTVPFVGPVARKDGVYQTYVMMPYGHVVEIQQPGSIYEQRRAQPGSALPPPVEWKDLRPGFLAGEGAAAARGVRYELHEAWGGGAPSSADTYGARLTLELPREREEPPHPDQLSARSAEGLDPPAPPPARAWGLSSGASQGRAVCPPEYVCLPRDSASTALLACAVLVLALVQGLFLILVSRRAFAFIVTRMTPQEILAKGPTVAQGSAECRGTNVDLPDAPSCTASLRAKPVESRGGSTVSVSM